MATAIFTEMSLFCHQLGVNFVEAAGMIIEYNPMHSGHLRLVEEIRARLGRDTAVIGVMSGNIVQRGGFAIVGRQARARAAVESGVDLVLELPLPWAVSSAESFADGGAAVLAHTGVAAYLAFGSECGDADALLETAACLLSPDYQAALRRRLDRGTPFAACRQEAVEELLGRSRAALLESPNNNLGVEYCKALLRRGSAIRPLTVRRTGDPHDSDLAGGEHPSATAIRGLLERGERDRALALMTPAMGRAYLAEEAAGRAPVFGKTCERAILARLRTMTEEEFSALDSGREGLGNRLFQAARTAPTLEGVLAAAKTKRYAHARLRRMILWAYLGLTPGQIPAEVPYLRVLAANETGRALLAQMRTSADRPVLTKPADVRRLSPEAQALFEKEARAADLYALAYPDLAAAAGGSAWREGPVIL